MRQSQIAHIDLKREEITKHVIGETKRYLAHDKRFWIRSDYQDDTWKIIDSVKYPNSDKPEFAYRDIDFTSPSFSDGTNLTDIENEHWNQLVRACLCFYRSGVGYHSATTGEAINTMKNNLVYCIDYLKANGIKTLSQATPSFMERFIFDYLPYGASYFLNWAERVSIALKKHRHNLPMVDGRHDTDTSKILREANVPERFATSEFFKSLVEHSELLRDSGLEKENDLAVPLAHLMPYQTLTEAGIRKYTTALSIMHDVEPFVRGTGIDTLTFNPVEKVNLGDLSNKNPQRTPTIPPHLALKLISQSITFIDKYADGLVSSYEHLVYHSEMEDEDTSKLNALFQKYTRRRRDRLVIPEDITAAIASSNTLHSAIFSDLVSACVVVLFAFSARRESEIYDLRSNCVDYENLLRVYIAKTDRAYDLIPKVAIVDKALSVLIKLSKHQRNKHKTSKILEFTNLSTLKTMKWSRNGSTRINDFAEKMGCHVDDKGDEWRYSEHQFRRFFAMMFYWHSDSKNIEALSYHLRHFSLDMTKKYIEEVVAGDIVYHVAKLKSKALIYESEGNESPMGKEFQKRLNAYKKFVLTKMNILNVVQASKQIQREYAESLDQIIESSIENNNLVPEVKPWGKCYGKAKGRHIRAKCVPVEEKKKRSVFTSRAANASCEDCMGCSNLYMDKNDLPFINIQIDEDMQVLEVLRKQKSANPTLISWLQNRCGLLKEAKDRIEKNND